MSKARVAAQQQHDDLRRDLVAVAFATGGALALASLLYHGDAAGLVPMRIASGLRTAVGLGAYTVPVGLFLMAAFYALGEPPVAGRRLGVGTTLLALCVLILLQFRNTPHWQSLFDDPDLILSGGGYVGAGLAWVLLRAMGPAGAYILVAGIGCVAAVLLTRAAVRDILGMVGNTVISGAQAAHGGVKRATTRNLPEPGKRAPRRLPGRVVKALPRAQVDLDDPESDAPEAPARPSRRAARDRVAEAPPPQDPAPVVEPQVVLEPLPGEGPDPEPAAESRKPRRRPSTTRAPEPSPQQPRLLRNSELFSLPSLSMLTAFAEDAESALMREEAAEQIIKLEDTLLSFGITATVSHYERGPVLTRYEVEPERGIRVNQVVRLADDLAMALAAVDVRVEAPIPGKSAIGIEVPNETRATVGLRSILETPEFQNHPSKLGIALGRDIAGKPVVPDIGSMPHLLIAGATGAGKSVCLHSLIISLLMRATPDEVRLIMVDPKRVELAVYDCIPHLMAPVVHSVKQAADVLRKAIREMEKRYDKFALKGVVNLAEYNALAAMPKQHATDEFDALPHVVIIIDELADLMMQARAEFEFSICRIAQLARATGIHLVLATQRPSVKVVTGNIKANIPTRIALAVASQVDSRTILDSQGAERLIGRGDMLYSPLDAAKPLRAQGAFIPRGDIERVVEHLRGQGEPEFLIIPETPEDEEDFSGDMDASDDLYAAAVQYIVQEQEASVSMIQRRFKVGYARAGRLIDMMEQRGVVGPHEGSKPRTVYIGPHSVEAALEGRRQMPAVDGEVAASIFGRDEDEDDQVLMDEPPDTGADDDPGDDQ